MISYDEPIYGFSRERMTIGYINLHTMLGIVVSTPHLAMKFHLAIGDIITMHGEQKMAKECYTASIKLPLPIDYEQHWKDLGKQHNNRRRRS